MTTHQLVVLALTGGGLGLLSSGASGFGAYLSIFLLIAGDAVIPVLPGETTLNTAAVLASQDHLALVLVILAGGLGAIVGDSAVYWIARSSHGRIKQKLEAVLQGPRASRAIDLFRRRGPVFIVFGRYVPGVRLVINFSAGAIIHLPYREFLTWSSIGGVLWATYTACLAYVVGTALADFPLASIVLSGAITTIGIAILIRRERHNTHDPGAGDDLQNPNARTS